eukprot:672757-Pelagomonas_calceolata.AAC.2
MATGAPRGVIYRRPEPGNKQIIAFSSHKLQPLETLYHPYEREMLAVIVALKIWHYYLLGRLFDLSSVNTAVTQFLKQSRLSPRQARWVMLQSEYDFNLYFLPPV